MQHQSLFIFDIETVPDVEAARNLLDLSNKTVDEYRQALRDYHLKITDGKNDFLRQPFHQVVAISFLQADIIYEDGQEEYVLNEIRSGGEISSTEEELIKGFFHHLGKLVTTGRSPRLVSFNGRSFDLPVLKYRAMKYGISASWLYKTGDKWNNYGQRYSLDWHCDLAEAFSDFGTSAKVKMNELCAAFNLPGKTGIDGSMVSSYYDMKKIAAIRNYCETDVLNTYLLYLLYQHHNGTLNHINWNKAKEDVVNYIDMHKSERPHLLEFLEEWMKVARK